jgi:hypothetical protein
MRRRLDEGVLEDIELLASITWAVATKPGEGLHMPYVRIRRKDGSEEHVNAAEEPMPIRTDAVRAAKAKAEEMIKNATSEPSASAACSPR